MSERTKRRLGFGITLAMIVGAIAVLNLGTAPAAVAQCTSGDGGGGTPSESASPSGSTSPSGSATGLLVGAAQSSTTPAPSSSTTGGGGITLPPILPSDSSTSASPSSPGGGEVAHCPTDVTIAYTAPNPRQNPKPTFHGRVKSDENSCIGGRIVTLMKKKDGPDARVGHDLSSPRGAWQVELRRANGRYYAKVKKDTVATDSGRAVCEAGRSKTLKV
ncbi:MAG TPA: hypothetical protein VFK89_09285 [Actinomycetota bacterium]|nr:hypothetical protein [Actinomycetota bacterium]